MINNYNKRLRHIVKIISKRRRVSKLFSIQFTIYRQIISNFSSNYFFHRTYRKRHECAIKTMTIFYVVFHFIFRFFEIFFFDFRFERFFVRTFRKRRSLHDFLKSRIIRL